MTIRTLPGNHLEIFISSNRLHDACIALMDREIARELTSKGRTPVVNTFMDEKLTLRDLDNKTVIRFRTEQELKGLPGRGE